jgi:hypothetical protein
MLGAADLRIDHVTICGADLKAMQAKLAAIGIPAEYGGPHNNRATEMALASFPDGSYLELIAIQPKGDPKSIETHEWSKPMRNNAGPCAWAARSSDVAAETKRLQGLNVEVQTPEKGGRNRPDGVRLDWETAQVGPAPRGSLFPFLIRDFTAREARVYPKGAPTTADFRGVSKVVVAVRDLDAAVGQYRKAYGWGEPRRQSVSGATLAYFAGTPVVLAAGGSWVGPCLDRSGVGPCAFVLASSKRGSKGRTERWFGSDVSWWDAEGLGFRLGFE